MDWKSRKIEAILEQALVEDKATSDVTTAITVDPRLRASATILAKQDCVVSGLGCVPRFLDIYARLDKKSIGRFEVISHPEMFDGVRVKKGQALAVIRHNARVILSCERVILNLMQRMSGIATLTRKYVDAIRGTDAKILDTRKTIPGLRHLEKYATRMGGAQNHRLGLWDAAMIKDNHVAVAGGVGEAVRRARDAGVERIICEVDRIEQIEPALAAGATHLLLDNMNPATLREAVALVAGRVPTEASGGVTLETIAAIAATGVDFVSVGRLTQSAPAADIGLDFTQA
jgi:nicotinate-nucleotide pyrophosphorylase (carboxylating)